MEMFSFDAAMALSKGEREYQEDAIISDFAKGSDAGFVVLADGMGGHAAGDIASKIVVTEVYSELMFLKGAEEAFETEIKELLHDAALGANGCLKEHMLAYPETQGMGATLVASVILGGKLYWISIGDSPLFLFRDGVLEQLNEDHSMAPQIDFMAKTGLIAPEEARNHPDRNTLTSVLFGADVPQIDCPAEPVVLQDNDILIVASDGLQFLSNGAIEDVLHRNVGKQSTEIVDELLERVFDLDDPDLDNVTFSVVKVRDDSVNAMTSNRQHIQPGIRCVG